MNAEPFHHEALMYSGWPQFLAGTVPFIREGVDAGEPVLVVESRDKIDALRQALGADAAERVMFADMGEVGANPARIIPAWREFVDSHGRGGKQLRGIGEPIWNGRSADELAECQRHESLLNVAFAGGQAWSLLCPYDTEHLDAPVIAEARRSHQYVREGGASQESGDYRGLEACGAPFGSPLGEPPPGARRMTFDRDRLLNLRREVMQFATSARLGPADATRLVTAVNEIATNSILHGGGKGTLRLWREGDTLVAEVRDSGSYRGALADRVRPSESIRDGRGLWLANQLCDLVQIRTLPGATVVRAHVRAGPSAK